MIVDASHGCNNIVEVSPQCIYYFKGRCVNYLVDASAIKYGMAMFPYSIKRSPMSLATGSVVTCYTGNFKDNPKDTLFSFPRKVDMATSRDLEVVNQLCKFDVHTYSGFKACAKWLKMAHKVTEENWDLIWIKLLVAKFQWWYPVRFAPVEGLHRLVAYASCVMENDICGMLTAKLDLPNYRVTQEICDMKISVYVMVGNGKTISS